MIERKYKILKGIVKKFVSTSKPISSKCFTDDEEFKVSSATIRNEMSKLEKEGLIHQPYTSSWRVPTVKWYKHFVKNLMNISKQEQDKLFEEFQTTKQKYFLAQAKKRIHDWVSILSKITSNVAFATIPENKETIFLWVSWFLKQPEFIKDAELASDVIEVLEWWLFKTLNDIEISNQVEVHIAESDLFEQFKSCSLLYVSYSYNGFNWVLWVVWPIRMDYAKNKLLIEYTKMFIEGQKLLS